MRNKDALIVDSFQHMLANLPPAVAERVAAKHAADRAEFLEYIKDKMPSKAPAYWAAKGCTRCNARGIIGESIQADGRKKPVTCSCTARAYQKWLTTMRLEYTNQPGTSK